MNTAYIKPTVTVIGLDKEQAIIQTCRTTNPGWMTTIPTTACLGDTATASPTSSCRTSVRGVKNPWPGTPNTTETSSAPS